MLAKRIIPCLDVKDNYVVKGVTFKNHKVVGDILALASYYNKSGADELIFYDITASCEQRSANSNWVQKIAEQIDIPFCVAGGIRSLQAAEKILTLGADKISINSPALENPKLISDLVYEFGSQCVVVGVDSCQLGEDYYVYQYTGVPDKMIKSSYRTKDWLEEVVARGAGEIVLNCMNQDGRREGYDLAQLNFFRKRLPIPLIASGGAGTMEHFSDLFKTTNVSGALAASVFHQKTIAISGLKTFLIKQGIEVRCV
jgi:cyclase